MSWVDPEPMALSADVLARLAAEADEAARGLEIRDLIDTAGGGVLLLLGEPDGERITRRLLLVAESGRARVHLSPPRRPDRPRPPESAFVRDARPMLRGARLGAVRSRPGDRLVTLEWSVEPGSEPASRLVAECFGSAPNLLLVDAAGVIRALKQHRKGRRPARIGGEYVPPPPPSGSTGPAETTPPGSAAPDAGGDRSDEAEEGFARAHPLSATVDATYHTLDRRAARDALLRDAERHLRRELATTGRLLERLATDLDRCDQAERQRQLGDLLSAHFHLLRPGVREVVVTDLYGEGEVTIPLERRLDPGENVERFYRRARKLERSREPLTRRIALARERHAELESASSDLAAETLEGSELSAGLLERLDRLEALPAHRRPRGPGQDRRAAKRKDALPGIRRFPLREGVEILVGKTNRDNDRLTRRIARGNDAWLHVQGAAGSHVVIRLPRGKTASLDDLLDAGALAVHYSKRRGAARCDVLHTQRKHVRKQKGAAPGQVSVERFQTLSVSDAEGRMQRLLERIARSTRSEG